jgi:hypothetical protein
LKLPFATDDFGAFFGAGDLLGRFRGGAGRAASPSDADKPESFKSSAWAEARAASLPPAEVEDTFFLEILMPAGEAFSAILSPDGCATNFLLDFKGLARVSSCVEV